MQTEWHSWIRAFSPTCAVTMEDCEGWWLPGSSVVDQWQLKLSLWVQFPVRDVPRTTKCVFTVNSVYLPECDVPSGPPVCGGGMDCVWVETEEVVLWSVVPKWEGKSQERRYW